MPSSVVKLNNCRPSPWSKINQYDYDQNLPLDLQRRQQHNQLSWEEFAIGPADAPEWTIRCKGESTAHASSFMYLLTHSYAPNSRGTGTGSSNLEEERRR